MATDDPEDPATGAALAAAWDAWRSPDEVRALARPRFTGYPFTLGVASGSPLPTGVVLWTRLAVEPLNGGGVGEAPIAVTWEVAEDERAGRSTRSGRAVTASTPRWTASGPPAGTSTASSPATR
jgi:alkaline phosphatase D